ncbi:MAG: hypothetical protein [Circular genetic element sp.]|nr:MAG: hypothetical protein [Circular genetic element sp.]
MRRGRILDCFNGSCFHSIHLRHRFCEVTTMVTWYKSQQHSKCQRIRRTEILDFEGKQSTWELSTHQISNSTNSGVLYQCSIMNHRNICIGS